MTWPIVIGIVVLDGIFLLGIFINILCHIYGGNDNTKPPV